MNVAGNRSRRKDYVLSTPLPVLSPLLLLLLLSFLVGLNLPTTGCTSTGGCFCELRGEISDCSCDIENVDSFNNIKVIPLLDDLLQRDYFRYYKVNMFRPCPFAGASVGQCGSRSCAVDECKEDQLPAGFKQNHSHEKNKYSKEINEKGGSESCEEQHKLGELDFTISDESREAFEDWTEHDERQDNFCELTDIESPDAVYYDLVLNPERFTGYTGPSAVNVWKLIYDQNCFKLDAEDFSNRYLPLGQGLCLEKRTFFRLISGFHTSINVDVTANWLLPAKNAFEAPKWGPNLEEFQRRFDPKLTYGEGPSRLRNLYFAYLVELRALAKVAPYLEEEFFYTGNEKEDSDVRAKVKDLLDVVRSFPNHFDESKLFQGDALSLKEEFKVHFRNISHIMDCVGCDKCRLWGKVQIMGMGTALKILFSGDSMGPLSTVTREHRKSKIPFQLTRGEIVSLFNAFGRFSKSIQEIEAFRRMTV